jgi:serine/threonine protein phosphatase PrpC
MPWTFATGTDIGGREEQQDRVGVFACGSDMHLAVVADGMGGHEDGAAAAQAVIDVARQRLAETGVCSDPKRFLTELCLEAHDAINGITGEASGLSAGSTCVLLYVDGPESYWAHVGDARLYHFRGGDLLSSTQDHSMLELLRERRGFMNHENRGHGFQHQIYMRLGGQNRLNPDVDCLAVDAFDAFLLCSDGFWELVDQTEMQNAVRGAGGTDGICERLIELARGRAGDDADNISLVLARWLPKDHQ